MRGPQMSRTQYVYCWFDQRYQAIKVGHSFRPGVRLLNYMVACNLDPAPDTLRMVSLEDWRNAQEIGRQVPRAIAIYRPS